MKKIIFGILALFFVLGMISCSKKAASVAVDTSTWCSDFEGAKVAAAKENKDIMLVIGTGDEMPHIVPEFDYPEYNKTFLLSDEFISEMTKKYVLVKFEFNNKLYEDGFVNAGSEQDKKVISAMKLGNWYSMGHLPCVTLLSKEGFVLTQFYLSSESPKTAEGFVDLLGTLNEEINAVKAKIAATESGTDEERITAMDNFYNETNEDLQVSVYEINLRLIELDKTNKSGLVPKHLMALANAKFMDKLLDGDVNAALEEIKKIAVSKFLDGDKKQELYFSAPMMLAQSGYRDYGVLREFFQKAYDASPNSPYAEDIKAFVAQVDLAEMAEKEQAEAIKNNPSSDPEEVDPSKLEGVVITEDAVKTE